MVIDGLGIGKTDDSRSLKSEGANTLRLLNDTQNLKLKNLKQLGLGLIKNADMLGYEMFPTGKYGRACSKIKTKNRFALLQEFLQIEPSKIPQYNPVGNFPESFMQILEEKCDCSFLGKRTSTMLNAVKENNDKHLKTSNPILITTGKSDLLLIINKEIYNEEENNNLFDLIIKTCRNSKYNFSEYHLIIYSKDEEDNKFNVDKNISKSIFTPLNSFWNDCTFIGFNFKKSVISENIINTKTDLETYKFVLNKIKESESNNETVFIHFNQLFYRLSCKDINGALNALNLIDLFIGEIMKSLDTTDQLLIIGTCGWDFSVNSNCNTKEAVPFILYSPNCSSQNFGTEKFNEILAKIKR